MVAQLHGDSIGDGTKRERLKPTQPGHVPSEHDRKQSWSAAGAETIPPATVSPFNANEDLEAIQAQVPTGKAMCTPSGMRILLTNFPFADSGEESPKPRVLSDTAADRFAGGRPQERLLPAVGRGRGGTPKAAAAVSSGRGRAAAGARQKSNGGKR